MTTLIQNRFAHAFILNFSEKHSLYPAHTYTHQNHPNATHLSTCVPTTDAFHWTDVVMVSMTAGIGQMR